eukprot:372507-Hanusia_phi.AAC.4
MHRPPSGQREWELNSKGTSSHGVRAESGKPLEQEETRGRARQKGWGGAVLGRTGTGSGGIEGKEKGDVGPDPGRPNGLSSRPCHGLNFHRVVGVLLLCFHPLLLPDF